MKNRGEVNIAVANYFNNNFCNFSSIQRRDVNIIPSKDDLKHIIIGRWYYGLYLLAKEKLGLTCKINHRSFGIEKGIWERLYHYAKNKTTTPYNFKQYGERLFLLRNKYEYNKLKVTDNEFNIAKNIYEEMYEKINKL
ncbi:hypothetical protein [Brachyspira pilosicoli]|uniref:hypothetical protein n=1 Tax=Brachyspira pilosicoli TaxID=52584 RepID=UPI003004FC87